MVPHAGTNCLQVITIGKYSNSSPHCNMGPAGPKIGASSSQKASSFSNLASIRYDSMG